MNRNLVVFEEDGYKVIVGYGMVGEDREGDDDSYNFFGEYIGVLFFDVFWFFDILILYGVIVFVLYVNSWVFDGVWCFD